MERKHTPGQKLEVFEHGRWLPCAILGPATYVGKSGPGYYAAYDPPRPDCASFWCHDGILRYRAAIAKATGGGQ